MKIKIDALRFAPLIARLFKAWVFTMRYIVSEKFFAVKSLNKNGQPFVIALWHDELFSIAGYGCLNVEGLMGIVSSSKDGEFIAVLMKSLGHTTVRGSSSRGGMKALLQAKRVMDKEKNMAVFAVDGPRGPRHEPKDGAIFLAQRAGAKIVPIRAYAAKAKRFEKAWDKFQLPYPFSRCELVVGDPYEVTTEKLNADVLQAERERLKEKLNSLKPR